MPTRSNLLTLRGSSDTIYTFTSRASSRLMQSLAAILPMNIINQTLICQFPMKVATFCCVLHEHAPIIRMCFYLLIFTMNSHSWLGLWDLQLVTSECLDFTLRFKLNIDDIPRVSTSIY